MVAKEMLDRIMGAPNSPTGRLVAMRRDPGDGELETGVWYSNFTRVKEEAERRGIPFFAMWTNGDVCGFCRRFTLNILENDFVERMRRSGGLWWLGGSMDDNDEDRRGGTGFRWCMGPDSKVNYFPFFAVSHKRDGKPLCEFFGSGHDYDRRKHAPEGTELIERKIAEIFASGDSGVAAAAGTAGAGSPVAKDPAQGPAQDPATQASPVKLNTVLHIRFNPDWDVQHIARFQDAMRESGGHCICSKDRTPDTMCMCKSFLEQDKPGRCHCGAFEKYAVGM